MQDYRKLKVWQRASNIAEGCGTDSSKEFGRYLDIAVKKVLGQ